MENLAKNALRSKESEQSAQSGSAAKSHFDLNKGSVPDYLQNFQTTKTIPSYFGNCDVIPPKLAIPTIVDQAPVEHSVNRGYERQKKVNQKRATQNAIQTVANINSTKQNSDKIENVSSPAKEAKPTKENQIIEIAIEKSEDQVEKM